MEQKNTNYMCHILLVYSIFNFLEGKWLRFVSGKEGRRRRGDVKFQFSNFQLFSNQGEQLCFSSSKGGRRRGGGMLCKNSIFNFSFFQIKRSGCVFHRARRA